MPPPGREPTDILLEQLLPPEVLELPEDLAELDAWLDDERFFEPFRDKYHKRLGRPSVPAETYLRITALKHQYRLSDRQVCAWVTDRISWRRFCRIPWNMPVPHASSLTKIRKRLDADGSAHMAELNAHLVRKAQEDHLLKSRSKVRVDTTVIEANIHYPTDSGLIADTVRVVTRLVKQAEGETPMGCWFLLLKSQFSVVSLSSFHFFLPITRIYFTLTLVPITSVF